MMDLSSFHSQFRDETTENIRILTDGLLAHLQTEDKANRELENLKGTKKAQDANLKKVTDALSATSKQLTREEARLASLKDKALNER